MKLLVALVLSLAFCSVAFGQVLPKAVTDLKIKSKNGAATAGDIIELAVQVPKEFIVSEIEPTQASQLKSGPIELGTGRLLWWKVDESVQNSSAILLGLTSYTAGKFEIPAIVFQKSGVDVFTSEPRAVEFSPVGGDKSKDDIYPPEAVSFPLWVWILLGFFSLGLVLVLIWAFSRWFKAKQSKVLLESVPRLLSPIEEFEKCRTEVEKKAFLEKAAYKQHYFALSDASKRFLGSAYRFDAEERTTQELMRELEFLGMLPEYIKQWESLFEEMDLTKFTDQLPKIEEAKSLAARLSKLAQVTYRISPMAQRVERSK